jgi:PST family polysaccharide transporter
MADSSQDQARASLRDSTVMLGSQWARTALSLMVSAVLARVLTPYDYGVFGMVSAAMALGWLINEAGLSAATLQARSLSSEDRSAAFWVQITAGLILTPVCLASAVPLARLFHDDNVAGVAAALSPLFLFQSLSYQHLALLRHRFQLRRVVVIETTACVASVGTALVLGVLGAGRWALVAQSLTAAAVTTAGAWLATGWIPGRWRRGGSSIFRVGAHVTGYNAVNYLARNLDNILLGRVWGGTELGLYARAYNLMLWPITQFVDPITRVALPRLSQLGHAPDEYRRTYSELVGRVSLLAGPAIAFLITCADWVVRVYLGPQWAPVSTIFAILGVCAWVQCLTQGVGLLLVSQQRSRELLILGLVAGAIAVTSFLIGLPWGARGVALAYAVGDVLVRTPFSIWMAGRRGPVRTADLWKLMLRGTFELVPVAGALVLLRHTVRLTLTTGLISCGAVCVIAYTIAVGARREARERIVAAIASFGRLLPKTARVSSVPR